MPVAKVQDQISKEEVQSYSELCNKKINVFWEEILLVCHRKCCDTWLKVLLIRVF